MGAKLNILTAIFAFGMILSLIPVVFRLTSAFMLVEFFIISVFLIFGTIIVMEILSGKNLWAGLFVFFALNIVNIFIIYSRTFNLTSLSIPTVLALFGLYVSAFKINNQDDEEPDIEQYYEEAEEKKPRKKAKKKKSKK